MRNENFQASGESESTQEFEVDGGFMQKATVG